MVRNAIVDQAEVDPRELTPNPQNWRTHPKAQQAALTQVLERLGWVQRILVNRTTGHLLDGHLRVEIAVRLGVPTVPVAYIEVSEPEEQLVLATLDPLGAMARMDAPRLAELLHGLEAEGELQALLAQLAAEASARPWRDAEPLWIAERQKAMQRWGTASGQAWKVEGRHSLLIADSRDEAVQSWIREGFRAEAIVTDPEYDADAREVGELLAGLAPVVAMLVPPGAMARAFMGGVAGWETRLDLVWHRRVPRVQRHRAWPVNYHVWILLATQGRRRSLGWRRPWSGFGSVVEVEQEFDMETFSHAKGTDLFVAMMAGFQWQRWVDPFLGGGTAILAGEHLAKTVVGIEHDPGLAALALSRFERAGLALAGPEPWEGPSPPAAAPEGSGKLAEKVRASGDRGGRRTSS